MDDDKKECPKCGRLMQSGIIIDRGHYSIPDQQLWKEGEFIPPRLFRAKSKTPEIPVRTFRCEGCGYLESYAIDEQA